MNGLSQYVIDIVNLKTQNYRFEFKIDPSFFNHFSESEIEKGYLDCFLDLKKAEGFIEVNFNIQGAVELECDRSLDLFDYPVNLSKRMIFKFGDMDTEIDDEVEMISHNRQSIDMAQYIYEFISMEIPMKRLHPRYSDETQEENDGFFYTSSEQNAGEEDDPESRDPRWEVLKKLKNN